MIECPKCTRLLPDAAESCQFCGFILGNAPRKTVGEPSARQYAGRQVPKWIWGLYYFFAALWIFDGARVLMVSLKLVPEVWGAGAVGQSCMGMLGVMGAIGAFFIAIGVSLIFRFEWARGVVNVICWVRILGLLFDLIMAIFSSAAFGLAGLLNVFIVMLTIAWTGAQIWVIAETD